VTASAARERALGAAVAVAEAQGLRFSAPVVLADGSNLLVHLRPAPVVARVPTAIAAVRRGSGHLGREVAVAGFLAARGAPVVAPAAGNDPGPHEHDGLPVTFWELAERTDAPLDASAAGRALRACHEALEDYAGDLPEHAIYREARAILDRLIAGGALSPADAALARRAGTELDAAIDGLDVPLQALHGDAHLGNVIQTARGPLWNDWEDTFRGPRAWDLACLEAAARVFGQEPGPVAAARAGYGAEGDRDLLDLLVDVRAYVGLAWTLQYVPHRADAAARVAVRLEWLRAREARPS
jgi:Ser/Thr protein kinase RdoA (MazF antagonist)